jgi:hypothetical protein
MTQRIATPARIAETAGPAGSVFAGPAFAEHPARACHGLLRRLPAGLDANAVRANLASAAEHHEILRSLRLWDEQLPTAAGEPASEARRARELARAVGPSAPVRAVVLAYADGRCDLALVAHRSVVDRRSLSTIAALLSGAAVAGALRQLTSSTEVAPVEHHSLQWGLGDPHRTGHAGRVAMSAESTSAPVLLAAAGLAVSRYASDEAPCLALIADGRDAPAGCTQVTVGVDEGATAADLVDATEKAIALGAQRSGDAMPAVGIVGAHTGDDER